MPTLKHAVLRGARVPDGWHWTSPPTHAVTPAEAHCGWYQEHAWPTVTQLPPQSVVPPGHTQLEPTQTRPPVQALPHAPQCAALFVSAVSQPLGPLPSQLPKPPLQAPSEHAPPEHAAPAFGNEHALPHDPQCETFVDELTSQPLAALPSQLRKAPLQLATVHAPPEHPAVAFASEHAFPHAPQWATVFDTFVSQPFAAVPSQLPKPAVQLPSAHAPAEQVAPALL